DPVPIESTTGERFGERASRQIRRGAESAAAVAEEDGDVARSVVGHSEIELAVAIEVTDRDAVRRAVGSSGKGRARAERPVAVAEKDADVVGGIQSHGEIESAVAVEITDRDRVRT